MNREKIKSFESSERYHSLSPCSAQDMTGLIPSGPVGEEELENYEQLYPFLPRVPEAAKSKK